MEWWHKSRSLAVKGKPVRKPTKKINLVTLQMVKDNLGTDHNFDDRMLERMRSSSSLAIVDYLKVNVYDTGFDWVDLLGEPLNVPGQIEEAVLLHVTALYENRDGNTYRDAQPISDAVISLLMRSRDPAMA